MSSIAVGIADEDVARQKVDWLPDAWIDRWRDERLPRADVVDQIASEYRTHGTIRRSWICALDDPETLFIAAMAWGFGDDARGVHRVAKMLTKERVERRPLDVVTEIVATTRKEGAAAGFASLFKDRRTRVHGLGISFGTKVLHFAGYETRHRPRPAILDLNVWRGAQQLDPVPAEVPDPRQFLRSTTYEAYCSWLESAVPQASPRVVEYALFREGRRTG